VKFEIELGAK